MSWSWDICQNVSGQPAERRCCAGLALQPAAEVAVVEEHSPAEVVDRILVEEVGQSPVEEVEGSLAEVVGRILAEEVQLLHMGVAGTPS